MNLERFNLPLNVRDFIEYFDNSKATTGMFTMLTLTLPTKTMQVTYTTYSGGKFQTIEKPLTHIWTKDVVERYYEMCDRAKYDLKINPEMWGRIMLVVKKVVEEEYRAYRSENSHSLLLHVSTT